MSEKKSSQAPLSKPKAVVIGSGFGGMAAAIRLQAMGFDTTILEKRDKPGGRAYVFEEQGFVFDAGPTVITAPECIDELFALAGTKTENYVKLVPVTPFYRLLWPDGDYFDYSNNESHMREQILRFDSRDWPAYQNFYRYSKAVFDKGYTELAHEPFLNIWSMLKVAPELIKLESYRSVYSVVAKYIHNEKLRQAFSFHSLLVGGNPFETSAIYTLIHYLERNWGVYFPLGGTGALVQGLIKLFMDMGGKLELNTPVQEICTKDRKVTGVLSEDRFFPAEVVVSNADLVHTYAALMPHLDIAKKRAQRLKLKQFSMSLFLIYFGTNRVYPDVVHHTIVFGPRYRGLLKEIFGGNQLPEDFSLYLHRPTATDPHLAPAGHDGFYVLSPVAHKGHLKLDWSEEASRYADAILQSLEQRILPDLRKHLVIKKVLTPDYFEQELGAYLGNAFSLKPTLLQSAYFRHHNKDHQIEGLYFVGAGTHPGAGVPGVINSAKATAKVIAQDRPFIAHKKYFQSMKTN